MKLTVRLLRSWFLKLMVEHLKEVVHTGIVELVADPRARFGGRVLKRSTLEYLGFSKLWMKPQLLKSI